MRGSGTSRPEALRKISSHHRGASELSELMPVKRYGLLLLIGLALSSRYAGGPTSASERDLVVFHIGVAFYSDIFEQNKREDERAI